ncbi:Protein of unknown function [Chitinophaga sp. YR573]|uniref:glycosyltransferase family 87 protein n=1 Tax=Chitinophaga sp. YR573 TaxID=1881040 RepID=UPI0008CB4CC5|nr:glycosyltransferase family 87 protein [Chitinophaga sp. YR573]SEW19285.1 Protein of unknown function [Chitinophaga sp. YR573]
MDFIRSSTRRQALFAKMMHPLTIGIIYMLATIILYVQAIMMGRYNNFVIFRASFYHLIHGMPLYQLYPAEYYDYFLYHPSFPVLFAPFAIWPKEIGLLCWLLASTALFLYTLRKLPLDVKVKSSISWFLLIELSNAIQSEQTNPAVAAFMVLTVIHLQRGQSFRAALFASLCFFIKGYGAIAALAFLFYPRKGAFIGWGLCCGIIGTALPLLFITPAQLLQHYSDWVQLLTSTTIKEDGSLLGMLHVMLGLAPALIAGFDKVMLGLAVIGLLYALLCGYLKPTPVYPWLLTAYLLIWVVIFNQSTEAPTYIIAATGVGIGCYMMPLQKRWQDILLWSAFIIVSLSPTDLIPRCINQYAIAWHIKALPCAVVLLFLQAAIGGLRISSVFKK